MDLRDWFFSVSTAHNFANLDFSFSNEVTLIFSFNLLRGGTPGLEVPYLHSTGYEPKASDARRFDTWFVLPFKQVICRDNAIVHPHLQSKIQESFEDCG